MNTVSDILQNINKGCTANNMVEDQFSYRIIYCVKEGKNSSKHHIDTSYDGLRSALEIIIRNNLTLTNSVVILNTITWKECRYISLQNRTFSFSLDEYLQRINGEFKGSNKYRKPVRSKRMNWY